MREEGVGPGGGEEDGSDGNVLLDEDRVDHGTAGRRWEEAAQDEDDVGVEKEEPQALLGLPSSPV